MQTKIIVLAKQQNILYYKTILHNSDFTGISNPIASKTPSLSKPPIPQAG
jgi:hypothetical protein